MTEATLDAEQAAALEDAARAIDRERMKQIGSFHFAMVMGALTLWGAAVTWAQVTGLGIAQFAAIANALIAAYVISSTIHEWGHFAGARLSGSVSPVLEKPRRHFFMFDFAMDRNDSRQFLWMSWGGILAPWAAVLLAAALVPLALTSGAVLVATLTSRAAATAKFEVPIALGVSRGGQPGAELARQLPNLAGSRPFGMAVGAATFVVLWLAA
ncbi:MAG: hypothetical protein QNK05_02100 [Myxococcota bacterium]|nr:hypothetical protein [Myxococcota bacterium]